MMQSTMRQSLVDAVRAIASKGLNSGTSGNISLRLEGEGMLITPTGISPEKLDQAAMVEMTLDGSSNGQMRPSSEWNMHAAIYKALPQAQAVVHAHPDHCVALSCLRQGLPPFHYMIASFGGDDVPCSDYAPFGTAELAKVVLRALAERNTCLIANHGMIAYGPDLATAVARTEKLETLARQYMLAKTIGRPVMLTDDELSVVKNRYRTYGQQNPK
ncbi:class II aldolase/adducin family protein [Mesorhizobium sp. BAC0120]|uniref:class II aldolase/adducin family protein n=1 Tax=Mesorhizobium sp. BAC0120 TaxID=3090670 RepID=UPI00298CA0CD|nr:class II aldolase/adducin family protein [Mesorhizobium sp. BAC0120]MDW6023821.1 class II aldolase/adducin family protein [Mesorhizobium sp. BAC0120]